MDGWMGACFRLRLGMGMDRFLLLLFSSSRLRYNLMYGLKWSTYMRGPLVPACAVDGEVVVGMRIGVCLLKGGGFPLVWLLWMLLRHVLFSFLFFCYVLLCRPGGTVVSRVSEQHKIENRETREKKQVFIGLVENEENRASCFESMKRRWRLLVGFSFSLDSRLKIFAT